MASEDSWLDPEVPKAPPTGKGPWIAAVLGALVLLVGGGFFAMSALGSSGGAASPEQAVDEMIEAMNNGDFVTMAELLEPSERRAIAEPAITEILPELIRLGVLDDTADPAAVDGVDLDFSDVTYRIDRLADRPDLVHVRFTGGEIAGELNAAALPFGDQFRDLVGADLEDDVATAPIDEVENPLVFVERDGSWYMSILFTVAETARLDANEAMPAPSEAPPALGSESPEAAVEAMFDEMVDFDLRGMIGRMDPEEMAVLYNYSPIFISDGQRALNDLDREMTNADVTWDINNFDFETETNGDEAVVAVRGFDVVVSSPDFDVLISYGRDQITAEADAGEFGNGSMELTPRSVSIEAVVDGERVELDAQVDPDAQTASLTALLGGDSVDAQMAVDSAGVCSEYSIAGEGSVFAGEFSEQGCLEELDITGDQIATVFDQLQDEFPGVNMSTRNVDGEWYVAPITSATDAAVLWLQGLEDDAIDTILEDFEAGGSGFFPGFQVFNELVGTAGSSGPVTVPDDAFTEIDPFLEGGQFTDNFDEFDFDDVEQFDDESDFGGVEATVNNFFSIPGPGEYRGSLATNTFDVYEVPIEPGQTLTVTMLGGGELDTFLTVITPDGLTFDNDDSSGLPNSLDSQVQFNTGDGGVYTIEARSFVNAGEGSYELIIEVG